MTTLYNAGTLMVASAGNTGTKDAARGAFDQVLFVAGTNNADKLSVTPTAPCIVQLRRVCGHRRPQRRRVSLSIPSKTTSSPGLSGTSFAAPTVAGVAALLLAQNQSYTRDQLAAKLLGTAVNIDGLNPGFAGQLGSGRVDALAALTATLAAPTITEFKVNGVTISEGGATVSSLSTITLTVPRRLNPSSVTANSFELRSDGPDNIFGSGDDNVVSLNLADPYRMGDTTITLGVSGQFTSDHYRFTAKSGTPYLRDPFDGRFNGDVWNEL